jgi:hypothetical protein
MTTEMDSIAEKNAPEIDCSHGDVHLSSLALGRIPDSPGAKRQTGRMSFQFREQPLDEVGTARSHQ